MSVRVSTLVWGHSKATGPAFLLMLALADQANDEGYCWPKGRTLARRLRLQEERSVRKLIEKVRDLGELTVVPRYVEGRQISNGYQINLKVLRANPDLWGEEVQMDRVGGPNGPGEEVQQDLPGEVQTGRAITVSNNRQMNRNNPPTPQGVELPEWLPEEVWGDWLQHRREIRKPMTATASQKLLTKLGRLRDQGHDPASLIDEAISNGWQSVYEPKAVQKVPGGARRPASNAEANQQFMDKMARRSAAFEGVFDE